MMIINGKDEKINKILTWSSLCTEPCSQDLKNRTKQPFSSSASPANSDHVTKTKTGDNTIQAIIINIFFVILLSI